MRLTGPHLAINLKWHEKAPAYITFIYESYGPAHAILNAVMCRAGRVDVGRS